MAPIQLQTDAERLMSLGTFPFYGDPFCGYSGFTPFDITKKLVIGEDFWLLSGTCTDCEVFNCILQGYSCNSHYNEISLTMKSIYCGYLICIDCLVHKNLSEGTMKYFP